MLGVAGTRKWCAYGALPQTLGGSDVTSFTLVRAAVASCTALCVSILTEGVRNSLQITPCSTQKLASVLVHDLLAYKLCREANAFVND